MSPRPKRETITKSALIDLMSNAPGVEKVNEITTSSNPVENMDRVAYQPTPMQLRSYVHLGIIHRTMANTEMLWRGTKPPQDGDDVLIDFLHTYSAAKRKELKDERDLFAHGRGSVDPSGRLKLVHPYKENMPEFSFTETQLQDISQKWLGVAAGLRIDFITELRDDSGQSEPRFVNIGVRGGDTNMPKAPEQQNDGIEKKRSLIRSQTLTAVSRLKRLLPFLEQAKKDGKSPDEILAEMSDDDIEIYAYVEAPRILAKAMQRDVGWRRSQADDGESTPE